MNTLEGEGMRRSRTSSISKEARGSEKFSLSRLEGLAEGTPRKHDNVLIIPEKKERRGGKKKKRSLYPIASRT